MYNATNKNIDDNIDYEKRVLSNLIDLLSENNIDMNNLKVINNFEKIEKNNSKILFQDDPNFKIKYQII
jgi:hypothetical protein